MVLIKKKSILLESDPSSSFAIRELDFFTLLPREESHYGQLDYVASNNCNLSTYHFDSLALVRGAPPRGWLSIIIKPFGQHGIGPFHSSSGKSTTIRSSSTEGKFWSIDLAGGVYYCISIRASLLAKHALGMVDTSILKTGNTLSIDDAITKNLIDKLNHIGSSSRSCAELDLRTSHLMLAICESISDQSHRVEPNIKQLLTLETVQLIQKNKVLNINEIITTMKVGKPKLDLAFKSTIGIGLTQFLNAYYLNIIRKGLLKNDKTLLEYAKKYGYKNAKNLSKEYTNLFETELLHS